MNGARQRAGSGTLVGAAIVACLSLLGPAPAPSQPVSSWSADSAQVHDGVLRFLTAFEHLEWETFSASFADEATVFFPAPEPPELHVGRAAVEARFRVVFDAIRAARPEGPPYHRLEPQDLRIEPAGARAALVTFHLRNPERIARRTILWGETPGGWRIVHLHASNAAPVP